MAKLKKSTKYLLSAFKARRKHYPKGSKAREAAIRVSKQGMKSKGHKGYRKYFLPY